jgi:hypothetical protein
LGTYIVAHSYDYLAVHSVHWQEQGPREKKNDWRQLPLSRRPSSKQKKWRTSPLADMQSLGWLYLAEPLSCPEASQKKYLSRAGASAGNKPIYYVVAYYRNGSLYNKHRPRYEQKKEKKGKRKKITEHIIKLRSSLSEYTYLVVTPACLPRR